MIARFTPSEAERKAGAFSEATLDKATRCMRADGVLVLEDIVNPASTREARRAFVQRYARYLDEQKRDATLDVGGGRPMITVNLEPPFDRQELFANSWLCPILSAVFEHDFVLDAYGVVCSLPGAPSQAIHQDGGDLFPQAALNRMLPIAAITVGMPLVEMNENHGTTAVWPSSHRDETHVSTEICDEPLVREGSCMLWDYRLRHHGTPNRSDVPRPLLYMTYCRPWFIDHKNYRKQPPIRASKSVLDQLPEDLRRLLMRAEFYQI